MKEDHQRCWWCASYAGRGERVELVERRDGETRRELLCQSCATNPCRTIWRAWRRREHVRA
jgi:hypothetical protein